MSYSIIKSIGVHDNKVFATYACNNVRPLCFERVEAESLTKILQEQGREALDLEIFREYENGNFQRGNNKYTRALTVLRAMPEYQAFNWRGEPYDEITNRRKTEDFTLLLKKALATPLPKGTFIVSKPLYGGPEKCYLSKVTKRSAQFTRNIEQAKRYPYRVQLESIQSCFIGGKEWNIEELA